MQIEGFRFCFLLIILASCKLNAYTQPDSLFVSKKPDSVAADPTKRHSLYFTSGVSDNLVIASSVSHRQLYYSASINYFYKNSFYLGASSFHLRDYSHFSAFNTITAGYYDDFFSWLDVNLSLSGYRVPEQLEPALFNSFINSDLKVGIDWNLIYTEISASRIFGEGSSFFYQVKNSRYVPFPGITGKKVHISLQPYAELIFGSMVKITFDGNTFTGVKSPTARWGSKSMRENFEMEESPDDGHEGNAESETTGPPTGDDPGKEEGPGEGEGNNPGPGDNSENPAQHDEQNPGPSENANPGTGSQSGSQSGPETGSQNGTQTGSDTNSQPGTQTGTDPNPQTGTQSGSEAGSQTGAPGEDTGNSSDPPGGQPGEPPDADPGTDNGAGDDKIVSGETDDHSPADQNNEPDPGNESPPGTNSDKPGSGPGSKGNSSHETPAPVTKPEWSITEFLGLMEIEIGLPVSFTSGRFIFEIEPGYVKSMYNDPYITVPQGFTFMMSVYIKLF